MGRGPDFVERAAKQSFIQGAVILTGSTLLVKAIGALFKVPLMNILGGTGMAYFMTAYEVFNPIYALSVAGFPAAVSRLVSEYTARGRQRDARRTLKIASALFLAVGAVGFALLYFGGKVFCRAVGNPDFGWYLALTTAMDRAGVYTQTDGKTGFHLYRGGQRLALDYQRGTDAQRFLLRALFPIAG